MKYFVLLFVLLCSCSPFAGTNTDDKTVSVIDADDAGTVDDTDSAVSGGDMSLPSDDDAGADSNSCELYSHNAGGGHTWLDCEPLGTYNATEALKACAAFCASVGCTCSLGTFCGANVAITQVVGANTVTYGWAWEAPSAGRVYESLSDGGCDIGTNWN